MKIRLVYKDDIVDKIFFIRKIFSKNAEKIDIAYQGKSNKIENVFILFADGHKLQVEGTNIISFIVDDEDTLNYWG